MPINVFGRQIPTGTATVIGVGGVGIAGYMVYRYKKQKKQATAVASSGAGYGYGQGYGYNQYSPYGTAGFGYGSGYYGSFGYGTDFGAIPGGFPGGGPGPTQVGGTGQGYGYGTQPQTQQQWIAAATTALEKDGYSATAVQNALGRWFLGMDLTTNQVNIVSAAIGAVGDPPGNVPPVKTRGGGDGQDGTGKVMVPNVVGLRVEEANEELRGAGLRSTFAQRSPNTPYVVTAESPKAGKSVTPGSVVHLSIRAEQKRPLPIPPRR